MSLRYNDEKDVAKMIKQVIYQVFWCVSREDVPEDKDECLSFPILDYDRIILWNNLIAFELSAACEPENVVITSYINFLKALIVNPDDVKELHLKHIVLNYVGNDEEMFEFFKEISTGSFQEVSQFTVILEMKLKGTVGAR
uniref:Uncharacterized protein n=1 Tax=Quercus lobata TaxID=97700 RepID=A0A7N2R2C1_QUELO